jgi:GTP-binding protein HflX
MDELLLRIGDRLRSLVPAVDLHVPYSRGDVLAGLHRSGDVLTETADESGVRVSVRLDAADLSRYDEFLVDSPETAAPT